MDPAVPRPTTAIFRNDLLPGCVTPNDFTWVSVDDPVLGSLDVLCAINATTISASSSIDWVRNLLCWRTCLAPPATS